MKERPILFSGAMVRAILEGNKTQTRRVMNPQPEAENADGDLCFADGLVIHPTNLAIEWPHGLPGDRLWVKETFQRVHPGVLQSLDPDPDSSLWSTCYRADANGGHELAMIDVLGWRPSIFCTRKASRITLEIESVRVERLQDISEADALAEGITLRGCTRFEKECRLEYKSLWESINGPGSWDKNPWVWAITFKVLEVRK